MPIAAEGLAWCIAQLSDHFMKLLLDFICVRDVCLIGNVESSCHRHKALVLVLKTVCVLSEPKDFFTAHEHAKS